MAPRSRSRKAGPSNAGLVGVTPTAPSFTAPARERYAFCASRKNVSQRRQANSKNSRRSSSIFLSLATGPPATARGCSARSANKRTTAESSCRRSASCTGRSSRFTSASSRFATPRPFSCAQSLSHGCSAVARSSRQSRNTWHWYACKSSVNPRSSSSSARRRYSSPVSESRKLRSADLSPLSPSPSRNLCWRSCPAPLSA